MLCLKCAKDTIDVWFSYFQHAWYGFLVYCLEEVSDLHREAEQEAQPRHHKGFSSNFPSNMLRNKIFGNTLPNKMLFHNVLRNVLHKILSKRVVLVFLRVVRVHAVKASDRPVGSNKRNILLNGDDPRRTVVVPLGVAAGFDVGGRRGC